MPGAHRTRSLACNIKQSTRASSPWLQPDSPGIPARNGFNGFLRALPGDRACLSPSLAISRQLDAGVEASGPHDFAVRSIRLRLKRTRVHRILSRVDDVAQRPSVGQDGANQ
jgi:hypothetical protein